MYSQFSDLISTLVVGCGALGNKEGNCFPEGLLIDQLLLHNCERPVRTDRQICALHNRRYAIY